MEDETDIYGDLPSFTSADLENLTEKNKKILERCSLLEKQVTELTEKLESAEMINKNLEVNLASLLRTAKGEISRKDRMIAELRREIEDMRFRRGAHKKVSNHAKRDRPMVPQKDEIAKIEKYEQNSEIPDTTEYVCDNPPWQDDDEDAEIDNNYQPNKLTRTVFGKRLYQRIIDEREEELARKAQCAIKVKNKPAKSIVKNMEDEVEQNVELIKSERVTESEKREFNVNESKVRSSLSRGNGTDEVHGEDSSKRNAACIDARGDKKRPSDDDIYAQNCKKLRVDDYSRGRYRERELRDRSWSRSRHESNHRNDHSRQKSDALSKREAEFSHRRKDRFESHRIRTGRDEVPRRSSHVSQGIESYSRSRSGSNRPKNRYHDEKLYNHSSDRHVSQSRSKSKDQDRYNDSRERCRSQSRTRDKYSSSEKCIGRQRDEKYPSSRDKFDKTSTSTKKDDDNLRESDRKSNDLRHEIGKNRKTSSSVKPKNNCDKSSEGIPPRISSRSRSGSMEIKRSKKSRRSESRDRRANGIEKEHSSNIQSSTAQLSKKIVLKVAAADNTRVSCQTKAIAETDERVVSSLEEGEIIGSAESSPEKPLDVKPSAIKLPELSSPLKEISTTKKLVIPEASESTISGDRTPPPTRFAESNSSDSLFGPMSVSPAEELKSCENCIDVLNSSKDERIENIADFIANFSSAKPLAVINTVETENSKPSEQSNIEDVLNITSGCTIESTKGSENESTLNIDPIATPSSEKNISTTEDNDTKDHKDWTLIEINYTITSDEDNRKYRLALQNAQLEKIQQQSASCDEATTDVPSEPVDTEKFTQEILANTCVSDSKENTEQVIASAVVSETKVDDLMTQIKSVYFSTRTEVKLTDDVSEAVTLSDSMHPVSVCVDEVKTVNQDKNEQGKCMKSQSVEKDTEVTVLKNEPQSVVENKDEFGTDESKSSVENKNDRALSKPPSIEKDDKVTTAVNSKSQEEDQKNKTNEAVQIPERKTLPVKAVVENDKIRSDQVETKPRRVSTTKRQKAAMKGIDAPEDASKNVEANPETKKATKTNKIAKTDSEKLDQHKTVVDDCRSKNDADTQIEVINKSTLTGIGRPVNSNKTAEKTSMETDRSKIDSEAGESAPVSKEEGSNTVNNGDSNFKTDPKPKKILTSLENDSTRAVPKETKRGISKIIPEMKKHEAKPRDEEQSENNALHVSHKRKLSSNQEKISAGETTAKEVLPKLKTAGKNTSCKKKPGIILCRRTRSIHLEDSDPVVVIVHSTSHCEGLDTNSSKNIVIPPSLNENATV